jgi:DNA-binding NtrC family response regulator
MRARDAKSNMIGGRTRTRPVERMPTKTVTMQGFSRAAERASPTGAGLVVIFATEPGDLAPVFMLEGPDVVLGREPGPGGFIIPQSAVSRAHARLTRDGTSDTWTIADLDSRNGTLVNGRFVREAALEDKDEIRVGNAILKFVAQGAGAFERYWVDGTVAPPGRLSRAHVGELLGGAQIDSLMAEAETVAATELAVLVQGETGTGKELVARALHEASGRRGKFCAINCAAIPPALIESELFGFKRGAFTGADRDKVGLVKTAHGGTLMLDEIGDMPLDAQAKVLRMIESRKVQPLGATESEPFDVRLVCATHRDLASLVESGGFRGDLYARIHGYSVQLPALRDRKEDIYLLASHFIAKAGRRGEKPSFDFIVSLCQYDWPYNVRELEAAIRRAVAVAAGAPLDARFLPAEVRDAMQDYGTRASVHTEPRTENPERTPRVREESSAPSRPRKGAPPEAELRAIVARAEGNVAEVARVLAKDRAQTNRWIQKAGIDPAEYRKK